MYSYACSVCKTTFPDRQSVKVHLDLFRDSPEHAGASYKRLNPESHAPFKSAYSRLDSGYRCNKCGLTFKEKQAVLVHLPTCPGPQKTISPAYDHLRALELGVGRLLASLESQYDYHPERHAWPRVDKKSKDYYRARADALLDRWEREDKEKRPSPLQIMAYGFSLHNWERVRSGAYALAYALLERERHQIYHLLHKYGFDASIERLELEKTLEDESIGPELAPPPADLSLEN